MEIRVFKETDRSILREIYFKSRKETFTWADSSGWNLNDFDNAIIEEEVLVAYNGDILLGFIAFLKAESFIHHLYIDANHKKKGVGKALLTTAVGQMQNPVRLKCLIKNKPAVLFYKKQGWKFEMTGKDAMGSYYLLKNK